MKKISFLLFLCFSLSACAKPQEPITIDLGEINFDDTVQTENSVVMGSADVATQEEVEALLQNPAAVSPNVILDQAVDFQGDKNPERVLALRAHPENQNLDYAVDLFIYSDDESKPVLLKYDQIYNDSTYGESYFLAVRATDLNEDGQQELFVNKILRGDNRYYVFGWDGVMFGDFPISKGYLNQEAYFGPLDELETYCQPNLTNVFFVEGTIQEDYLISYCGGTRTLHTVTQAFDGKSFTAKVDSEIKVVDQNDLGEFSYHLDPRTGLLTNRDGALVLDEDLREYLDVNSMLELSIATQYMEEGSDYVFFKTQGGCEGCDYLLTEGFKITQSAETFTVEPASLINTENIGKKSCFANREFTLDGKKMICSDRGSVWVYFFPGYESGYLFPPTQNLTYMGDCMGLCEGDFYWRTSDSQVAIRVYRDPGAGWSQEFGLRLYDLNNNLLYETYRLE